MAYRDVVGGMAGQRGASEQAGARNGLWEVGIGREGLFQDGLKPDFLSGRCCRRDRPSGHSNEGKWCGEVTWGAVEVKWTVVVELPSGRRRTHARRRHTKLKLPLR